MKNIQLITILCLFSIFTTHTNNNYEKIEELTEKIITQDAAAALFKPGAITKIGMYGAATLAAIRIFPIAWGLNNHVSIPQKEIENTTKDVVNFAACALIAYIIRSYSRSLQEICLSKKKAYEKQLELIANRKSL